MTSMLKPVAADRDGNATADASRKVAGDTESEYSERRWILLTTWVILIALALVVVLLRLQRLDEVPAGLNRDEGIDGALALRVLEGEHAVFFPVDQGREPSAIYALALSTSLLGRNLLAMRLPTALGSAAMVFALFWMGRLLFGRDEGGQATPWRGLLIGGAGAGLMAVSMSQTIIGRTSYSKITHMPLLLVLCISLLWWGWDGSRNRPPSDGVNADGKQSWWRVALAGVCAGLLPYTYIPARFTPFLFFLFGISFLLPWGGLSDRGEMSGEQSRLPRRALLAARLRLALPRVVLFAGVAGLVAAPILIHFALHPEHFLMRSSAVWLLREGEGSLIAALLANAWDHLLAFGWRGDPNWRHNFAGRSMLNPVEALFFWLGVGLALWRWQRPAYRLLLLWLGVLVLPAMLSRDENVPHFLRMMGATPAVYLLTGAGLWEACQFIWNRATVIPMPAARSLAKVRTPAAILLGGAVGGMILVKSVLTYRTYFQVWAGFPEIYRMNETEWTELAHTLNARPAGNGLVYLVPYEISEMFSFKYLYHGGSAADVIPAAMPYVPQEIRRTLLSSDGLAAVGFIDWKNERTGGDAGAEEHISLLLDKYGSYLGSDEFDNFRIHTYTDLKLDRSWSLYEHLEPLELFYDDGNALAGVAMGQGETQLSALQPASLIANRPVWIALRWQAGAGIAVDSSISLRLHSSGGGMVYQKDAPLLDANHRRTSSWAKEVKVDTLFQIDPPPDLAAGDYELRLVVYDSETLRPAVETGLGKPESVLARLRLAERE